MAGGSPAPRPRVAPLVAVLVVLAAGGLVLVVLAARAPASHPFGGAGGQPATLVTSSAPVSGRPTATTATSARPTGTPPPWAYAVLVLAALGAASAVARMLVQYLRRRPRRSRRSRRSRRRMPPGTISSPIRMPSQPAVAAAVDEALPALDDRRPVAASVIAFWLAVGESLRRAGVDAQPAETSTELVERVLTDVGGDAAALHELSALYREARFSTHRMTEAQRATARERAVRIRDGLVGARHG